MWYRHDYFDLSGSIYNGFLQAGSSKTNINWDNSLKFYYVLGSVASVCPTILVHLMRQGWLFCPPQGFLPGLWMVDGYVIPQTFHKGEFTQSMLR